MIRDLDEPRELARIDFGPLYERAKGQPEYQPGDVLAADEVVIRASGRCHTAKRAAEPT